MGSRQTLNNQGSHGPARAVIAAATTLVIGAGLLAAAPAALAGGNAVVAFRVTKVRRRHPGHPAPATWYKPGVAGERGSPLTSLPLNAAGTLARAVRRSGRRVPGIRPSLEQAVAGKTIMVTGASSGIGRATALKLGEAGATVILVARRKELLEEVDGAIVGAGGQADIAPCDLSDEAAIDRMVDAVLERHEGVDILINNAGRSIRRSIDRSYDRMHDFRRTMELNYFAAVKLVLRLLPGMRERGSGHIVNVSTMGLQTNTPRFAAYLASKWALEGFSRAVAAEVLEDGVHFSTVYMPLVRTPMIAPTGIYKRFPAKTPEEAADMIAGAIVGRPKRVATPLGRFSEVSYLSVPMFQDAIMNAAYRLFPEDSRASAGSGEPGGSGDGSESAEPSGSGEASGSAGRESG
jgi:NAD(P)-dependent dehydrogenase (short-subunit alcohol dehydrogenase family)